MYTSPGMLSCAWLFGTPRTLTLQAPLFMGPSRRARWSGLPFPSPGDLPDPGGSCVSVPPALEVGSLPLSCQAPRSDHTSLHSQQQCRSHPVYFNQQFTSWSGCRVGGHCQGIWYRATVSQGDFFLSSFGSVSSLCCYGAEDFVCLSALTWRVQ